jgi:two-component system, NarL family, response regulator NreC
MMRNAMSSTLNGKSLVDGKSSLARSTSGDISTVFIGESVEDPMKNNLIHILLIDDRVMVREGLAMLIEQEPDFAVVGQESSVSSAKELHIKADVVVADIDVPDPTYGDVVPATGLLFPDVRLLALSMVRHPVKVQNALDAGVDGYLLKTAGSADLLTGIRALGRGETYLQPSLGIELVRWNRSPGTPLDLSQKEQHVLQMLVLGNTNPEIARYLGVSLRTVETHRSRVYQKLGLRTRAELVQYARTAGLLAASQR